VPGPAPRFRSQRHEAAPATVTLSAAEAMNRWNGQPG